MEKARKAYFKIKKIIGLNNPCRLLEKLFDSLVTTILTYSIEVGGVDSTFKNSDPFEKLHIKFIKEILGIHCKAPNDGCRAELNRTPLKSKILFSIFNFMNHIISSKNTVVYDIYIKSRETNPWIKKVKNLLNGLGRSYIINNINSIKLNLNTIKQRIHDQCLQTQNANICDSQKLNSFPECLQYGSKTTLCGCFKQ
jgi:hypothetical protein